MEILLDLDVVKAFLVMTLWKYLIMIRKKSGKG